MKTKIECFKAWSEEKKREKHFKKRGTKLKGK